MVYTIEMIIVHMVCFVLWYLMFSVIYLHIYQENRNKFFLACMVKKCRLIY